MRAKRLVLLSLLALILTGCVAHTATPAKQGGAYVVVGSFFGSDTYYCDADRGVPECWEVLEQEQGVQ